MKLKEIFNFRKKEPKESVVNVLRLGGYSDRSAMTLSAVYRCVNAIADSVAQLPLDLFKIDENGYKSHYRAHPAYTLLKEEPNGLMTRSTFMKVLISQMLLNGNGYAYIMRDDRGNATSLNYIPSSNVSIAYISTPEGGTRMVYEVTGFNNVVEPSDMIHILNFTYDGITGVSTLTNARKSIELSHNANDYAKGFFENGGSAAGVLTVVDGRLKEGQAEDIRNTWNNQFNPAMGGAGGIAVLDGNMKYQSISINPADAQMLESRAFDVIDICRFFGVTPVKVFDYTKGSYNTVEAAQLAFLTDTLAPILENIELEFKRKIFRPSEKPHVEVKFDTSSLLRADKAAQAEFFQKIFQTGAISPNEIRKVLDLPSVDNGDKPYIPVNMQEIGYTTSE